MKIYHSIVIFLILFLTITASFAAEVYDFRLKDIDNKTVKYSQLKGEKLTIIDFWATWCKPCVRAIPKLVELYEKYKDRGVEFIGVNVDGTRSLPKVKPVSKSLKISYPVLLDINTEVMTELNIDAVPTLLIVNEKDEIIAFHKGYRPGDEEVIDAEIEKLLTDMENSTIEE